MPSLRLSGYLEFVRRDTAIQTRVISQVSVGRQDSIEVIVLHTTTKGTLEALKAAAGLANGLSARIRLLVPRVVPYPLPLDSPDVAAGFTRRQFRTVAAGANIDTQVDIQLGRDKTEILESALNPHSLVVLGGRRSWWPNAETRLAKKLPRLGHEVVFTTLN
jgi:hypothetical protein